MPDENAAVDSVYRAAHGDMETRLASYLPGLSDEDLADLAVRVDEELQVRVGDSLSDGLTVQQLEEFGRLIDDGADRQCNEWLLTHRPNYRATVAVVRAELVAEVVRTVVAANPAAADGHRSFGQLLRTSIDLAEVHLQRHGIEYTRNDGGLELTLAGDGDETEIVAFIGLAGSHADTFTLTGNAVGVEFPHEDHQRVSAFAADGNLRTCNPKALVVTDEYDEQCRVMGEVDICVGPRITKAQVDVALSRAIESMRTLFADVHRLLTSSETDGQRVTGRDSLIWPQCDGLIWPRLVGGGVLL